MEEKNKILPLIPLRGMSVFPKMVVHFDVGREKSKASVEAAIENKTDIFLSTQKDIEIENPNIEEIYKVGTICRIKQIVKLPNEVIRVLVEGLTRAELKSLKKDDEYLKAEVEIIDEPSNETYKNIEAYIKSLKKSFSKYLKISGNPNKTIMSIFKDVKSNGEIADIIATYVILDDIKKQEILQELNLEKRIEKLLIILENEIEILKMENKIGKRIKENLDNSQKEYYIREQIKVLQEEIGEESEAEEIERYEEQILKAKMPKSVKDKSLKELSRLKSHPGGSEANVIRTYLDWILDLPWSKSTKDSFNIKESEEILNKEHYGLEEVKERIIEFLAVKKHTNSLKGPILCLVGPPGVGKTSIAKSIANATNRKFSRMSLGGVRDEAEIRGHRRTYVGAIPGRLAYSLKEVKVNNPLILLDEIDKLGHDTRGNVADALLEVLDSEQNNTFRDNYLEVEMDLSKVLFITTANSLDTIPGPLLDRMEIIEVSGYTYEEKYHIAKNHLIPKLLKEHKLNEKEFKISDSALKDLINYYTREAGVRSLERTLGKLIRKSITEMLKNDKKSINISANRLEKYLGSRIFIYDVKDSEDRVGVVKGMAWTAAGGDTLPVESVIMKGTGKLVLTGQLGDVMQESAKIAYGYVRSNAKKYGIDEDFYKTTDIHIHFPEGAIKKDGPSAGITIITSIISALTNKKVRSSVSMTGEVTLTGRVLAIGGLKEKAIAAFRAGIEEIIIPKENEKDIIKIPASVRNKLKINTVDYVEEVLNKAIIGVK